VAGRAGRIVTAPPVGTRSIDASTLGRRHQAAALILALFVLAITVIVFPARPAAAAPPPVEKRANLCSLEEWQADFKSCVARLPDIAAARAQCLEAPPPDSPDAGLGGWFATQPKASTVSGLAMLYTDYGYAGYSYTTYDIGCVPTLMHPDYKFENTVANGEFMLATAVIGASNGARERAWDPGLMWGWADPLVQRATQSIYTQVFSVFGVVTLLVVGIYLLWRSRQAEMSAALTTAGWALLVMVSVTALAKWPVASAHLADNALTSSLSVVHDTVGPPRQDLQPDQCPLQDKEACKDHRPPAVRASDTAVRTMLYRNWLRGLLGSADSPTAQKYGEALYDARSLTWDEENQIKKDPSTRDQVLRLKNQQWMKVAEQIRSEDPEAYQYLQGTKGMERIGAGLIALLSAIMFALFDLTASLLVLLGFLIFRWAVIAAPILGTVALLRPASAGFRRLANAVVAALFNIVIFGTGAAVYLYAVDLIMNTTALPGWLQIILVWLCGIVGWLLLRPYRRVTQMGGKDPTALLAGGTWHRRFFRDVRETAPAAVARPSGVTATALDRQAQRVEIRAELPQAEAVTAPRPPEVPHQRQPPGQRPTAETWADGGGDLAAGQTVYHPRRSPVTVDRDPAPRSARAEGRRD
jgi:hypothetical protein